MEDCRHEIPTPDADIHGTSEWVLIDDDGHEMPISIADLTSDGEKYVIYWNDDTWDTADTFDEAKRIALEISRGKMVITYSIRQRGRRFSAAARGRDMPQPCLPRRDAPDRSSDARAD